jgi:hypothetical protein
LQAATAQQGTHRLALLGGDGAHDCLIQTLCEGLRLDERGEAGLVLPVWPREGTSVQVQ